MKKFRVLVFTLIFVLTAGLSLSYKAMASDILIGVQAPITGKYANEGQGIAQAVKLIVSQENAKGGVLGRKIKVIVCDDGGTAVQAAICARDLVNKGVIAVIGSYTSTSTEAAEVTYYRAKVLQTSDGTSDRLTKHGYWTFFRNSFPNSAEATFTAKYLVNKKHYKRIVVLSDHSSYSDGLSNAVAKAIKKAGGKVLYRGRITSGAQNFTPILTKIKSMNPDVIYFGGYYTDGGLLRAQQVQLRIKADFVGGDSVDNPDFFKLAGQSAAGTYLINVPTPTMLPYPLAINFLKAYKAKYHMMPPSIWTLLNTDGLRAILHAIKETGTTNTVKLAKYLHNLKNFPGITGQISFLKNGERTGSSYMVYIIQKNGSYKIVYKEH